jgi:hypothetical protein
MTDEYERGLAAGIRDALTAIGDLPTGRSEDVMEGQEQAYRAVEVLLDNAPVPNAETVDALQASKTGDVTRIASVDDIFADLEHNK